MRRVETVTEPLSIAEIYGSVSISTVRAFRGMKRILIITIALFASCSTQKRATPCRQCPQYSISEQQKLEYIKLNPFPHQIAYEKVDKVYFSVDK